MPTSFVVYACVVLLIAVWVRRIDLGIGVVVVPPRRSSPFEPSGLVSDAADVGN
jgi:hypothetical protein